MCYPVYLCILVSVGMCISVWVSVLVGVLVSQGVADYRTSYYCIPSRRSTGMDRTSSILYCTVSHGITTAYT